MRFFKGIINREFNFWYFQIFGWIFFEIIIHVSNIPKPFYEKYIEYYGIWKVLFWWTTYDAIAFLITIGFRYIYRYLFQRNVSIIYVLIVVITLSVVSSVLWTIGGYFVTDLFQIKYGEFIFLDIFSLSLGLLPILLGWSLLYFGIKYWLQMTLEKEKTEKANFLAQNAQLQMLRYQLNPHFLFNSLNSIFALIDEDRNASKSMVSDLSEFLRYTLINNSDKEVEFIKEIEVIKYYLSIEKRRFEDKFEVYFEIDPKTEKFLILSFLLHPIVENALKYGMKTSILPLKIFISAKCEDDSLTVIIRNSGKWVNQTNDWSKTGTGIENIKKRLELSYPNSHYFSIDEISDFVVVTVTINGLKQK